MMAGPTCGNIEREVLLFHNEKNGTFREVTLTAGLSTNYRKSLG